MNKRDVNPTKQLYLSKKKKHTWKLHLYSSGGNSYGFQFIKIRHETHKLVPGKSD